jgi:hypothetical protein
MGGIKLTLAQEKTGWARKKIKAQRQARYLMLTGKIIDETSGCNKEFCIPNSDKLIKSPEHPPSERLRHNWEGMNLL